MRREISYKIEKGLIGRHFSIRARVTEIIAKNQKHKFCFTIFRTHGFPLVWFQNGQTEINKMFIKYCSIILVYIFKMIKTTENMFAELIIYTMQIPPWILISFHRLSSPLFGLFTFY